MEFFEDFEGQGDGFGWEAVNFLTVAGAIEDGLVVFFHGGKDCCTDIEFSIHRVLGVGEAVPDCVAEVFDVQELVAVMAATDHGEAVAGVGPIVEECEDAEAFGADERFWAEDGDAEAARAGLTAEGFRLNLCVSVGADADEGIGFEDGVFFWHAVDGGGGDLDHAGAVGMQAGVEHIFAAIDFG